MASLLLLLSLLVFSTLCYSSYANGVETHRGFHSVALDSLQPSDTCSSIPKAFDGNRLPIVHRHGPCSPVANRQKINHKQILRDDIARVNSLNRKHSMLKEEDLNGVTIPDRKGYPVNTMDYIVTVGYGTPAKNFSVIFDTGSDISWIQCKPCADGDCYPQHEQLFDPSQSSTYANIPCMSEDCALIGGICDESYNCIYSVDYGDGSSTTGLLAKETLTLTPTNVLNKFEFGCGNLNDGSFGTAAGLIGLGRNRVSLASQASAVYGDAFSYCLPKFNNATGFLTIGAQQQYPGVEFTPMLTDPNNPSFYFVELVGISVGGRNLSIRPAVFKTPGTIMDSGTVLTYLPPGAYLALRHRFRSLMRNYTRAPPFEALDTCYDFRGEDKISIPDVKLHFGGGATLDVISSGTVLSLSPSQTCLAFRPTVSSGQLSIIGNTQQRSTEVVYDLGRRMIGFGPRSCS
ncbi:aspartyl protease family protein At5g10770-like [Typha angustifolia]|uniref:aspartyl protease family protein At5g10770-like n=1 Tax=Typha angustifolia TaxID=59011 RepID=UPI003C2BFD41